VEYTGTTPVIATALGGDRGASRLQPARRLRGLPLQRPDVDLVRLRLAHRQPTITRRAPVTGVNSLQLPHVSPRSGGSRS